jgi:hypothetical protein
MISVRSVRNAAGGAVGAGALAGAMLFGSVPAAQAAPAPATNFAIAGPHGSDVIPTRGGWGGGGHGGWGGGGHGGGWGGHPGWGNGGWGPPGLGYRPWWNWWW